MMGKLDTEWKEVDISIFLLLVLEKDERQKPAC